MSARTGNTRTQVTYRFEENGAVGTLPESFRLVRDTEQQRQFRGQWLRDSTSLDNSSETVATLTRWQLARLIADGAEALSFNGTE